MEAEEVRANGLDVVVGRRDDSRLIKPVHLVRTASVKNDVGLLLSLVPHRHLHLVTTTLTRLKISQPYDVCLTECFTLPPSPGDDNVNTVEDTPGS